LDSSLFTLARSGFFLLRASGASQQAMTAVESWMSGYVQEFQDTMLSAATYIHGEEGSTTTKLREAVDAVERLLAIHQESKFITWLTKEMVIGMLVPAMLIFAIYGYGLLFGKTNDAEDERKPSVRISQPSVVVSTRSDPSVVDVSGVKEGMYTTQNRITVQVDCSIHSGTLATLENGTPVNVVEVREVAAERRMRGRIAAPAGWISLMNLDDGTTPWVRSQEAGTRGLDATSATPQCCPTRQ